GELNKGHWPVPSLAGLERDFDSVGVQGLVHLGIVGRHHQVKALSIVPIFSVRLVVLNRYFLDVAFLYGINELTVSWLSVLSGAATPLNHAPERDADQKQDHPKNHRLECRTHSILLSSGPRLNPRLTGPLTLTCLR